MIVVVLAGDRGRQRRADRRRRPLPRAPRRASPRGSRPGAAPTGPWSAVLAVLAVAIFVFGVIGTNDARQIEPAGPERARRRPDRAGRGQGPAAARRPRPPRSRRAATRRQAGERPPTPPARSRSTRSPSSGCGASSTPATRPSDRAVLLRRAGRPGGHAGRSSTSPRPTCCTRWHVPALGGQVQASPGEVVETWFKADEVGRYAGSSTVFSRHRLSRRCAPGCGS